MSDVSEDVTLPKPTFEQTFSWLDGEQVFGDYGWMTSDEAFTGSDMDADEPRPYLVETWERTAAEVRWAMPTPVTCCHADADPDGCDIDAVAWWEVTGNPDPLRGSWVQVCERHRPLSQSGR